METLVALRRFTYARRTLVKGEQFTAPARDAQALRLAGSARAATAADSASGTSAETKPRRYRRRDMQAED